MQHEVSHFNDLLLFHDDHAWFSVKEGQFIGTSGSSSTPKAVNLFCSCKPLGRAGAFLFVPEVTNFILYIPPKFALMLEMDIACTSIAAGVQLFL